MEPGEAAEVHPGAGIIVGLIFFGLWFAYWGAGALLFRAWEWRRQRSERSSAR